MSSSRVPSEEVGFVYQTFKRCWEYWNPDRRRQWRNSRMVFGSEYGQWPEYVVSQLLQEERQAPTFNIIENKVVNTIGMIIKNQLDVKFASHSGDDEDLVLKLQDMWYSDYNNGNWDKTYIEFLKEMLTMVGYERMDISTRNDPLGNIVFVHEPAHLITLDPEWQSMYTNDLKMYFRTPFMSVPEIMSTFRAKIPQLKEEFDRQKFDHQYGQNRVYPMLQPEEKWGQKHQVIEQHYLEDRKEEWEFDLINREWFPDTDQKGKVDYAHKNKLGTDDIKLLPRARRVQMIKTICPTLTNEIYLEDGESIVQVDRVDIFPMGYQRYNGHFKGMVDNLYDLQQNINKGIMDMVDIRQRTARGGSFILDPDIVKSDGSKMDEIETRWNLPGGKSWSSPGAFQGGKDRYILELPESHIPQDLMNLNNFMFELSDRLSTIPAAAQGMQESAKESGRLFNSKYEAGLIAQGTLYQALENHWQEKAEAYIKQAKITYSGKERRFGSTNSKKGFTINKEIEINGEKYTEDDISRLPRIRLDITQSPKSLNVRTNNRAIFGELMHSLPQNLMVTPIMLAAGIFDTMDLPTDKKDEIKYLLDKEKQNAIATIDNNIAQMALAKANAEMQLKQIQQQQQGGAGQPQQAGMGAPQLPNGGQPGNNPMITPNTKNKQEQLAQMMAGTPQQANGAVTVNQNQ